MNIPPKYQPLVNQLRNKAYEYAPRLGATKADVDYLINEEFLIEDPHPAITKQLLQISMLAVNAQLLWDSFGAPKFNEMFEAAVAYEHLVLDYFENIPEPYPADVMTRLCYVVVNLSINLPRRASSHHTF